MKGKKSISKYPNGGKSVSKKLLPKTVSKSKFPINLDPRLPSDNTKSDVVTPSNVNSINSGFSKDDLESMLAMGSLTTPFPLNYGLGLAGSAIDLYDAYNADTPRERNNQLAEAALGAIPYGRIVKGAKAGTDFYKAYKSLKGLNTLNKGVDVKDAVNPSMQYSTGGTFLTVGDEYHRIYKNADGDIIVNHPKEDKGKWDTINLTDKANAKTVAQGVAATKKWHRENPYEDGGKIGEDFAYDRWRRSLPENLKYEDPNYNLRGYWESLNKPELFNPMEFQTEDDGFYHASSRNPETGEILKGKLHPTLQHALDEDRKSGYFTKMKNGKIYTDTYSDGGTINNMKKRTLKKYQYSYGGLTVTDLNKYGDGGVNNSSTGATVGNIAGGVGMVMPVIEGLIPDKSYTDSEGNDLGSRKSIGESTLSSAASGAALGSFAGPVGTLVGGALGAGYGAVTGWMEKNEMEEKQKKANFDIQNKKLYNQMNTSVNWGNAGVNTSNNMMFPNGGMVLNYDDPNANAELELQETFQMPDGTVGNVDGPSHEMGGIAVDLPEGTRIWSDKLKYNGKTFAKHTKPITNKIARLEKEIAKSPNNSEAKENSIALLNQQLDYYFDTQETNKETNEMKRTLRQGGMIKRESWGNNTDWEIIE